MQSSRFPNIPQLLGIFPVSEGRGSFDFRIPQKLSDTWLLHAGKEIDKGRWPSR